jgi:hypothetical protein
MWRCCCKLIINVLNNTIRSIHDEPQAPSYWTIRIYCTNILTNVMLNNYNKLRRLCIQLINSSKISLNCGFDLTWFGCGTSPSTQKARKCWSLATFLSSLFFRVPVNITHSSHCADAFNSPALSRNTWIKAPKFPVVQLLMAKFLHKLAVVSSSSLWSELQVNNYPEPLSLQCVLSSNEALYCNTIIASWGSFVGECSEHNSMYIL